MLDLYTEDSWSVGTSFYFSSCLSFVFSLWAGKEPAGTPAVRGLLLIQAFRAACEFAAFFVET